MHCLFSDFFDFVQLLSQFSDPFFYVTKMDEIILRIKNDKEENNKLQTMSKKKLRKKIKNLRWNSESFPMGLPDFSILKNLRYLTLRNSNLKEIPDLYDCKKLRHLDVSYNPITEMKYFDQIKIINIIGTLIIDIDWSIPKFLIMRDF